MMVDIIRLSSTLAEHRRQQLFQEMEADESIFRNAVMMSAKAFEDLEQEKTAVSQRKAQRDHSKADILRHLSKEEISFENEREKRIIDKFRERTNGNNIIRDNRQWAFPNYRHVSKDYLWMQNLALQ